MSISVHKRGSVVNSQNRAVCSRLVAPAITWVFIIVAANGISHRMVIPDGYRFLNTISLSLSSLEIHLRGLLSGLLILPFFIFRAPELSETVSLRFHD